MPREAASLDDLLPRPRRGRRFSGTYRLRDDVDIVCIGGTDAARATARLLGRLVARGVDLTWRVCAGGGGARPGGVTIEHVDSGDGGHGDQWYQLRIRPDGIRIRASGAAGLRYGALTLGQLIATGSRLIRAMEIEDWPDFAARGVMLDISRDKAPTLLTLRRLVDLLAGWKINQLQLYTEHTFAYAEHEPVWRGASPMTGEQIERLDRYCLERGVELVPNQNSFGHMERWLRHQPYADLAEMRGPWRTPWGDVRTASTTLCPVDSRSIRLVAGLYEQLLPRFSSGLFNVGCDETFELGQGRSRQACRRRGVGRVYLEFLRKIHQAVRRHGRRMMFWADIVQQHPTLIAELPRDVVPLVWGYEADHPFDETCGRLTEQGLDFYVCPGTSSWCSIGGRTQNCLTNLRNAAASGRRHGACGYLITDWGDYGHRQYQPVSYAGFLYGAAVAWCGRTNASIDAARELSRHAFHDPSGDAGRLWCEAGTIHESAGVPMTNRTVLFAIMQASLRDAAVIADLTARRLDRMERHIKRLEDQARSARFGGLDGDLVHEELTATLAVLRHACWRARVILDLREGRSVGRSCRRLAKDMEAIIERHRSLWLSRNRRGGLASSLGGYRRNLAEYRR